jgi:hypothetical protein
MRAARSLRGSTPAGLVDIGSVHRSSCSVQEKRTLGTSRNLRGKKMRSVAKRRNGWKCVHLSRWDGMGWRGRRKGMAHASGAVRCGTGRPSCGCGEVNQSCVDVLEAGVWRV